MNADDKDFAGALKSGRIGWWVGGLTFGVSAAIAVVVFLYATFAQGSALEQHVNEERAARVEHESRLRSVEQDDAALKATMINIHEDMHWQREQEKLNAARLGAPIVPDPPHVGGKK